MTTMTIDGNDLYYEDTGEGPAVVLAHGWGSSARVWAAQQADLVSDHRVVSYDERGCGRSGRPATGNSIARNAADLLDLCHRLELEAPVLVGNSIGATFATEAALAEPDYVAGVVAINGPGHWARELAGDRLALMRQMLRTDRAGTIATWVPGWYGAAAGAAVSDWTVRQILDSGPFIDELFDDQVGHDPREALQTAAVPICYLHGRDDTQVPLDVARVLAGLTPRSELIVINDAGHMPHQEQPAATNAALRRFIANTIAGKTASGNSSP